MSGRKIAGCFDERPCSVCLVHEPECMSSRTPDNRILKCGMLTVRYVRWSVSGTLCDTVPVQQYWSIVEIEKFYRYFNKIVTVIGHPSAEDF